MSCAGLFWISFPQNYIEMTEFSYWSFFPEKDLAAFEIKVQKDDARKNFFDKLFISLDIHVINVRFLIGNMFICICLFIYFIG